MEVSLNHPYRVGAFVLSGIILAVWIILALGGDTSFLVKYISYEIKFDQVQGLNQGSIVSVNGIRVGNVKSILLNDQNEVIVTVNIQEEFKNKITEDALAEIRTQGALGDKYVYVIPGTTQSKALSAGGRIKTKYSPDILGIISEKGGETGKIFDIISDLQKIVRGFSQDQRTDKILNNLTLATSNLNDNMVSMKAILEQVKGQNPQNANIQTAIVKLNSILDKIDKGEGTLGGLINDPAVHEQLKTILGANQRTNNLRSLMRNSIK